MTAPGGRPSNFRTFDARLTTGARESIERSAGAYLAGQPAHIPARPSWDCQTCGRDWPCDPARERLATESLSQARGRSWLAMLMWGYLEVYSHDAGPGPLADAFERFIAWTR